MFWRSIPRAVDVLARPADEQPALAPPSRPPRPAAPHPSAPTADSDSTDDEDGGDLDGRNPQAHRQPSRPPSRTGGFRGAVQAVIADERRRAPESMGDVVLAAMEHERMEHKAGKGRLADLLKKRKSVVDLFRKGSGRDHEGDVSSREGGRDRNGHRAAPSDDSSDDDRVEPAPFSGPATVAPSPPRASASSTASFVPRDRRERRADLGAPAYALAPLDPPPAPSRPTPYRSATSGNAARQDWSPPPPPRASIRRSLLAVDQERAASDIAPASARTRPRPSSYSRPADVDPYQAILSRSVYRGRDEALSSDDASSCSSDLSPSSRSTRSLSDAGSSDLAAEPPEAVFALPRASPHSASAYGVFTGADPTSSYRRSSPPPSSSRPALQSALSSRHASTRLSPPYTGLVNLGNTCYLACVLQALVATDSLGDFFANDNYLDEINVTSRLGLGGALAKAFARLVRIMRSGEYRSASPAQLRATLGRLSDRFLEPTQQDAHEVLLALLDGLHEDLNLVVDPPVLPPNSPEREAELERLPEVVAADQEWEKYRSRNDSIIIDFFQGHMRNRMECMHCQQTSTTFSPLQTLSLSIPTPRTPQVAVPLSQCIEEFLAEEILHGENAWHCPSCQTLRSTSKRFSVARLPQVLIIHLKRFDPLAHKLTTRVSLPLGPVPLGHLLPPLALDSPYALNAPHERETTYELYAACCHLGEDGSGHYTTLLREPPRPSAQPDDAAASPSFVLLDDETVDPLSSSTAQAAALRDAETTAYLLFFRLRRSRGMA